MFVVLISQKSLGAFQSTKRLSSTPLLSGKKRLLEKEKEPIGKSDAASKYDFDSSFGSSHSTKKTSTAFEGTSGDYLNSVRFPFPSSASSIVARG